MNFADEVGCWWTRLQDRSDVEASGGRKWTDAMVWSVVAAQVGVGVIRGALQKKVR